MFCLGAYQEDSNLYKIAKEGLLVYAKENFRNLHDS